MNTDLLRPGAPLHRDYLTAIDGLIDSFITERSAELGHLSKALAPFLEEAKASTLGGKHLRPAFCTWGYFAANGDLTSSDALKRVLVASASLDVLQSCLLVHDDVIDQADLRRGRPSSYRTFADLHRNLEGVGDADTFGRSAAILLGDLLHVWHDQMFTSSGFSATEMQQAIPLVYAMRAEVQAGQYLDVFLEQLPDFSPVPELGQVDMVATATTVVEYKSARYSVMRPVQIGAALAGANRELIDGLERFGSPLGQAFQLRDDVLGVFGDQATTGKPSGDDVREGKRTVLIAHALKLANRGEAAELGELLRRRVEDETEIARAQQIISASGALDMVEADIARYLQQAHEVLSQLPINDDGRTALANLAEATVNRTK